MVLKIRKVLLACSLGLLATAGAFALATRPANAEPQIILQGSYGYPPPQRYEPVPALPYGVAPHYVQWQPGNWVWNGYGYVWVPGRYIERRPSYGHGYWAWDYDGRRYWHTGRDRHPHYRRDWHRDHRYDRYDGHDRRARRDDRHRGDDDRDDWRRRH